MIVSQFPGNVTLLGL